MAIDPAIATVDYDPRWPGMFEVEKRRLRDALGDVWATHR
jgi:GrpB-like predicted nucleotidyltransferase (UPF0157 family)